VHPSHPLRLSREGNRHHVSTHNRHARCNCMTLFLLPDISSLLEYECRKCYLNCSMISDTVLVLPCRPVLRCVCEEEDKDGCAPNLQTAV
jgi:hypothetical protein